MVTGIIQTAVVPPPVARPQQQRTMLPPQIPGFGPGNIGLSLPIGGGVPSLASYNIPPALGVPIMGGPSELATLSPALQPQWTSTAGQQPAATPPVIPTTTTPQTTPTTTPPTATPSPATPSQTTTATPITSWQQQWQQWLQQWQLQQQQQRPTSTNQTVQIPGTTITVPVGSSSPTPTPTTTLAPVTSADTLAPALTIAPQPVTTSVAPVTTPTTTTPIAQPVAPAPAPTPTAPSPTTTPQTGYQSPYSSPYQYQQQYPTRTSPYSSPYSGGGSYYPSRTTSPTSGTTSPTGTTSSPYYRARLALAYDCIPDDKREPELAQHSIMSRSKRVRDCGCGRGPEVRTSIITDNFPFVHGIGFQPGEEVYVRCKIVIYNDLEEIQRTPWVLEDHINVHCDYSGSFVALMDFDANQIGEIQGGAGMVEAIGRSGRYGRQKIFV